MKTFKTGQTYTTRSICDQGAIFSYTVVKRTAKRLALKTKSCGLIKIFTKGIYILDGSEACKPEGNYSMCPVIRADR